MQRLWSPNSRCLIVDETLELCFKENHPSRFLSPEGRIGPIKRREIMDSMTMILRLLIASLLTLFSFSFLIFDLIKLNKENEVSDPDAP